MEILIKLFWAFLKIGTFSFGGGYAMLPFIQKEVVESNGWISMSEFTDIIGISQMTPGPVAINSATFVGYKIDGVLGSIFATLGVVTTSFILVTIISKILNIFEPIIFPIAISLFPFIAAVTLVTSSGKLVPTAKIVKLINFSLKLK